MVSVLSTVEPQRRSLLLALASACFFVCWLVGNVSKAAAPGGGSQAPLPVWVGWLARQGSSSQALCTRGARAQLGSLSGGDLVPREQEPPSGYFSQPPFVLPPINSLYSKLFSPKGKSQYSYGFCCFLLKLL